MRVHGVTVPWEWDIPCRHRWSSAGVPSSCSGCSADDFRSQEPDGVVCGCTCTKLSCDRPHVSSWEIVVLSSMSTRPKFHSLTEGESVLTEESIDKRLPRDTLLDEATLPQLLHSSFCRVKNFVHTWKSEESYVNDLLLKSVKNKFLCGGGSMHLYVFCRSKCFYCIDVIVFKCSVSSLQYEIH